MNGWDYEEIYSGFITIGMLFTAVVLLSWFSIIFLAVYNYLVVMEETTISKFKICTVDNPIENDDTTCGNSFPVGIQELYACGYVNAAYLKPGNFIHFQIVLDNDTATVALYYNSGGDQFTTGNFCRKLIVPSNSQPGLYHVRVYVYRKNVASAQFELK